MINDDHDSVIDDDLAAEEADLERPAPHSDWAAQHMPDIARRLASQIELDTVRGAVYAVRLPNYLDLAPVPFYRHPVSGRQELAPEPGLVELGRYLRRARHLAHKSQQRVADEAGVTQSMVSRAERGVAPGMSLERFVSMCKPIDRLFPFGWCPHDHDCPWQPIKPPPARDERSAALVKYILQRGGAAD